MIAEPLLIDAEVVEKDDKESRTPTWVRRADWSSGDALIAFWSVHPPEQRDAFLIGRAESYAANIRAQIVALRQRQHELWKLRGEVIAENDAKNAAIPGTEIAARNREQVRAEGEQRVIALRSQMQMSRAEVKRCVRYLRVIQPKEELTYG